MLCKVPGNNSPEPVACGKDLVHRGRTVDKVLDHGLSY